MTLGVILDHSPYYFLRQSLLLDHRVSDWTSLADKLALNPVSQPPECQEYRRAPAPDWCLYGSRNLNSGPYALSAQTAPSTLESFTHNFLCLHHC